jgi:hypothetical protein
MIYSSENIKKLKPGNSAEFSRIGRNSGNQWNGTTMREQYGTEQYFAQAFICTVASGKL